MKERPILFNGEMVRRILSGDKCQTRRPIKKEVLTCPAGNNEGWDVGTFDGEPVQEQCQFCYCEPKSIFNAIQNNPLGQNGDRLWVRETWTKFGAYTTHPWDVSYRASKPDKYSEKEWRDIVCGTKGRWKPSIHMPRWASRITLEIENVRVERLKSITPKDAKREGAEPSPYKCLDTFVAGFAELWDSVYVKRGFGWDKNCWVWVVDFKRVEQ